jgi:alanyl-tRNA synthetase
MKMLAAWFRMSPRTERLYYRQPFLTRFKAKVIDARADIEDGDDGSARLGVILDSTAFYPTGGGQPHDTGTLAGLRVVDVREDDEGPLHVVEMRMEDGEPQGARITVGGEVEGRIDFPRRLDHMQQHSGQHLLSRAFIDMAGAKTLSFHLGAEICTIDVELSEPDEKIIRQAEQRTNEIIWDDRAVDVREISADEAGEDSRDAAAGAGLSLKPGDPIRIIDFTGFDATPCGGTHVSRSGQVGIASVMGWERYKGKTRVTFICGGRVGRQFKSVKGILDACVAGLSAPPPELPGALARLVEERDSLKKKLNLSMKKLAGFEAEALVAGSIKVAGYTLLRKSFNASERSVDEALLLVQKFTAAPGRLALVAVIEAGKATLIAARTPGEGLAMGDLVAAVCDLAGGRGGGSKHMARAGGLSADKVESSLDEVLKRLPTVGIPARPGKPGKKA